MSLIRRDDGHATSRQDSEARPKTTSLRTVLGLPWFPFRTRGNRPEVVTENIGFAANVTAARAQVESNPSLQETRRLSQQEFEKGPRPEATVRPEVSAGRCQRCKELKRGHFGPITGGLSHHEIQDLRESASLGCELCKCFLADLESSDAVGTAEVTLDSSAGLINYRFRLSDKDKSFGTGKVSSTFEVWDDQDKHEVNEATEQRIGAEKTINKVYRRIASDPKDESCVSLARRWIATCLSSHLRCTQPTNQSSPTRLLNIKDSDPFLVPGRDRNLSYATLSYCWGSYRQSTTTTSNVESHEHAISMATLPKSFQDAIWLARKLEIDYLWIDALCILQDSDSDKAHECARMGDYYRNSAFTISALDAADASQGFLAPRPNVNQAKLFSNSNCYIRRRSQTRAAIFQQAPLSQRGWTLQERLLSSRVLHYSNTEIFWECFTCTGREGSVVEHRDTEAIRNTITAESEDFKRMTFSPDIDPFDPDFGALAIWYRLITHFARRSLTYQNDRLPAIAGLAATMASKMGYHYMAGVWEEDLEGLLWQSEILPALPDPNTSASDEGSRIAGVPSWSWASLNPDSVSFLPARERRLDHSSAASVMSIDIEVDADNPYGKVKGGSITLLAVCRKAACGCDEYTVPRQQSGAYVPLPPPELRIYWLDNDNKPGYLDLSKGYWDAARGFFDELSTYEQAFEGTLVHDEQGEIASLPECSKQFMAILIRGRKKRKMTKYYFLLVVEDQANPGCWKRVGMGWSGDWAFDLSIDREIVVLV